MSATATRLRESLGLSGKITGGMVHRALGARKSTKKLSAFARAARTSWKKATTTKGEETNG